MNSRPPAIGSWPSIWPHCCADQRQDQLEDGDDQGEEDEVVHRLGQPAEEEAPGGVKERTRDEDGSERDQQSQGDLGDHHHAEAHGRRQGADQVDQGGQYPRAEVDRAGLTGDLLGQVGRAGEELIEGRSQRPARRRR